MSIQYFGEYHNPTTDDANSPSGPTVSLTPPSNMQAGDFVLVSLVYRGQVTWTNSTSGGQTWSSSANTQSSTTNTARLFWCIFNGTWSADPVFTVTTGTAGAQGWMVVWKGVNEGTPWDVTPVISAQTSSLTFVIATFNTVQPESLALVGASSQDNNTWSVDNSFGPPSGSGNIYWRSSSGTDNSLVIAKREFAAGGSAVGQTTMTQDSLGADLGVKWYGALRSKQDYSGQAQAHVKTANIQVYAQAQATIKIEKIVVVAQAQAQIVIQAATYTSYSQAQSDIKQTYQVYTQANAQIKQTYQVYAQAQSIIRISVNTYAQAQAAIVTTNFIYAQAQGILKNTYQIYAQANTIIITTYREFAQSLSQIKTVSFAVSNAQCLILGTNLQYAQSQGQIKLPFTENFVYANALGVVGLYTSLYTAIDEVVPDNSDFILSRGNNDATVQLDSVNPPDWPIDHILRVRAGTGNSLVIKLYSGDTLIRNEVIQDGLPLTTYEFVLTPSEIAAITDYSDLRLRFTSGGQGSVVTWVEFQVPSGSGAKKYRVYGQAQAKINATYVAYAQAQVKLNAFDVQQYAQAAAWLEGSFLYSGQAQARILAYNVQQYAQSIADIKQTYKVYANAQVWIKITGIEYANVQGIVKASYQIYGQSLATIKQAYQVVTQSNAYIKITNTFTGQAQAKIIAGIPEVAQAQARIKNTYQSYGQASVWVYGSVIVSANAQAKIKAFAVRTYAQANAHIRITGQGFANAQSTVNATYTQNAQAIADIKQAYTQSGYAQGTIKETVIVHGQSNTWIKILSTYNGQAQALVSTVATESGQANAWISISVYVSGNAQAFMLKAAGYGQANALITFVHQLKKLRVEDTANIYLTLADRRGLDLTLGDRATTLSTTDSGKISLTLSDRVGINLILSDREFE